MDLATREALTAQFRAYLDTIAAEQAAEEQAPDQLAGDLGAGADDWDDGQDKSRRDSGADGRAVSAAEGGAEEAPAPDLFSFFAELAALKNEVKLESRQVRTALEEFRGLFDNLRESQTRLADEQERRCEQTRAADRAGWRDMLLELVELRDRLQAGQEQAARFQPHWYARNRREARLIGSLAEGMAMNLRRLEESLARRGVRPIATVGRLFDPHRMRAAELTREPEYRNGEVMAESRPGWLLHDDLLRLAEVVVNRIDTPESMD
ncbi:nucleotide exchange factor GrpE [Thiorhodovibrio frisius]|uniref:Molecular chaperone GrpE (Heat shock protein) n=1 Tax=Thiorhodovibrio frisius TaxID=631362 RepID=H8Z3X7_9GAMM|nr:nucleotide exchange factor GrpE [Thiorhodovibrio frisius]EIC21129.1 molecular chaperone GrpE (heat shock protein) [Thiorhodovibrio frisius]WPL22189.1 HSP-70 cofactor [Thiorhodovibrio frisius]